MNIHEASERIQKTAPYIMKPSHYEVDYRERDLTNYKKNYWVRLFGVNKNIENNLLKKIKKEKCDYNEKKRNSCSGYIEELKDFKKDLISKIEKKHIELLLIDIDIDINLTNLNYLQYTLKDEMVLKSLKDLSEKIKIVITVLGQMGLSEKEEIKRKRKLLIDIQGYAIIIIDNLFDDEELDLQKEILALSSN